MIKKAKQTGYTLIIPEGNPVLRSSLLISGVRMSLSRQERVRHMGPSVRGLRDVYDPL